MAVQGANTDGYLYDNIVEGSGDWAIRCERVAGWFAAHSHVYNCQGSGTYLDHFWGTFFHDNEIDIFGVAGGSGTYVGCQVQNVISGREGSFHDNQSSTQETSASASYTYYLIRCPVVTVGIMFHDNFAHRDSGTGSVSLAYSFVASSGGAMTVYGVNNKLDGPATAYTVSGGETPVLFNDAQPGHSVYVR